MRTVNSEASAVAGWLDRIREFPLTFKLWLVDRIAGPISGVQRRGDGTEIGTNLPCH